jgi:hypothetical protein
MKKRQINPPSSFPLRASLLQAMLLLTIPSINLAQSSEPATLILPSTRESVPANQRTARGTMKILEAAAAHGDADKLIALIEATTPTEDKYVRAFANNAEAQEEMRQAIAAKFPDEAKAGEAAIADQLDKLNASFDQMIEVINGDTAIIGMEGAPRDAMITLKREGGRWVLPFDSMFPGATDLDQTASTLDMMTRVLKGMAADTAAGKFKSMDEVRAESQKRIIDAEIAEKTATQPSTQEQP